MTINYPRISLYANCNPLHKNQFVCVESSQNFGCSCDHYQTTILPDSVKKLKELGYECYTIRFIEVESDRL